MSSASCLSDDNLRALLLGELSNADAAPLEEHLLECPECVARTRRLESADTVIQAVRLPGNEQPAAEEPSVVDRLVRRFSDRSQVAADNELLEPTEALGSPDCRFKIDNLIASLEPPTEPGELGRLGGFRILEVIGHGGMGAVLLAEDVQLHRRIALKLLLPDRSQSPGAVERFLREARAGASVRHENVVTIFQVGESQGVPFIAQELLEGETLERRLQREGKLAIEEAVAIGRQIANGLAAAHSSGLLHRDIKPSNVFIVRDNLQAEQERQTFDNEPRRPVRVKILDFGLAQLDSDDGQLTQEGMVLGTPEYMSPEQAKGEPLDARSDIFSLGILLYRMVTGRLPFEGNSTLSRLRSLAVDEPKPARMVNASVPAELSDLICQLLSKDPAQRPETALQVTKLLGAIEINNSAVDQRKSVARHTPNSAWLALGAVTACAIAVGVVIISITRPDGSRTKIEVDGDAKVEILADNGKGVPKDVSPAIPEKGQRLLNPPDHRQPDRQLLVSEDFTTPHFLESDEKYKGEYREVFYIRDDKFTMKLPAEFDQHPWWRFPLHHWTTLGEIEISGRATTGSWGFYVKNDSEPAAGMLVALDASGKLAVWRTMQSGERDPMRAKYDALRPKAVTWHAGGEFNTLRAAVEQRQMRLWINGDEACEPLELSSPMTLTKFHLSGQNPEPGLFCEFDSVRLRGGGNTASSANTPAN